MKGKWGALDVTGLPSLTTGQRRIERRGGYDLCCVAKSKQPQFNLIAGTKKPEQKASLSFTHLLSVFYFIVTCQQNDD